MTVGLVLKECDKRLMNINIMLFVCIVDTFVPFACFAEFVIFYDFSHWGYLLLYLILCHDLRVVSFKGLRITHTPGSPIWVWPWV